jgi:hypothetical protein
MSNGEFEEHEFEIGPLSTEHLKGWIAAKFTEDENGVMPAPNIVSSHEAYFVHVKWGLKGHVRRHICGKWRVKIDLESIGAAAEYTSPVQTVPMHPCEDDHYIAHFKLSPGDVKPDPDGTVYLVAVTLSSLDPCDGPGHIWGYCKGPSVMFVG